jgi:5-methylcytosine-specific restriction endonuclease McrA
MQEPVRGQVVKRSRPLRSDPERTRAWQRRSARAWRRTLARAGVAADDYRTVREARRVHAFGLCEIAGPTCTMYGTEAHHVLPRSKGGTDEFDGLLWVCQMCHSRTHQHPEWAKARGFLRDR